LLILSNTMHLAWAGSAKNSSWHPAMVVGVNSRVGHAPKGGLILDRKTDGDMV